MTSLINTIVVLGKIGVAVLVVPCLSETVKGAGYGVGLAWIWGMGCDCDGESCFAFFER